MDLSRGLGDVYKRQSLNFLYLTKVPSMSTNKVGFLTTFFILKFWFFWDYNPK
jgi:hypothetical protein